MNNKITLLGIDFHFGIGFINELLEGTGLRLDELSSQEDYTLVPKIMYYARLYAAKRKDIEIDFDMASIFDLIDYNGGANGVFWNAFKLAFNDSMTKDVPVDDTKKKVAKITK
jgi:hypothetical protein